jgi:hypothetical protein
MSVFGGKYASRFRTAPRFFWKALNERHAVEVAAWSAPGVKAVDDRLSVGAEDLRAE